MESNSGTIVFRVQRALGADTTYPLVVFSNFTDQDDAMKSEAILGSDFSATFDGVPFNGTVVIPAGESWATVRLYPIADDIDEVPEAMTLEANTTSVVATHWIKDAEAEENNRLFIAQMRPIDGVKSSGSGQAVFILNGDNTTGSIDVSFYGMSSEQISAHLQYDNSGSDINIASLPKGQFEDYSYTLEATAPILSDQEILDAILAGEFKVSIESQDNTTGEIESYFTLVEGSQELEVPDDPSPIKASASSDELDQDIARFLQQATFGPTPELVEELRALVTDVYGGDRIAAFGAWIDTQFDLPSPSLNKFSKAWDLQTMYKYTHDPDASYYRTGHDPGHNGTNFAWNTVMLNAKNQARQRLTHALSEIIVVSRADENIGARGYGLGSFYDMLSEGASSSFRELLEGVSRHPIMATYLSSLKNQKSTYDSEGTVITSPDENYAREVMQLFSIGLSELHEDGSLKLDSEGKPIPTYVQDDIVEMARVFTGWSFSVRNSPSNGTLALLTDSDTTAIIENTDFSYGTGVKKYESQWENPMKNFAEYHDDEAKYLPTIGLVIDANTSAEDEMELAHDALANHSSTAPFIVRRLIQRTVCANPSNGYIYRVVQKWNETGGNLQDVFKTILLDYEARELTVADQVTFGKRKEPLIQYVSNARALGLQTGIPLSILGNSNIGDNYLTEDELSKYTDGATLWVEQDFEEETTQATLGSPTVFNYFTPDYAPSGTLAQNGLASPEQQLINESSVILLHNSLYTISHDENGDPGLYREYYHSNDAADLTDYDLGNSARFLAYDSSSSGDIAKAYLSVMDTNNDGYVSSLDTTFNNRSSAVAAVEALVDQLDLMLCAGRLKRDYAADYVQELATDGSTANVRSDNPRDLIIHHVAATYQSLEGADPEVASSNLISQESIISGRIREAAYFMSTTSTSQVQR